MSVHWTLKLTLDIEKEEEKSRLEEKNLEKQIKHIKHCLLNHINIRRKQTEKRRQWILNLINVRRRHKENGRQDNSFGDGYELYF